jgi:hypothetical protein
VSGRDGDRWIVPPGEPFALADREPGDTTGAPGGKDAAKAEVERLADELFGLQERLYAESERSLLVVLQAMDAGGKDGTIKHVFAGANPQGVRVTSFKAPTGEELAHDFLWRIHAAAPPRGYIGIFNRSHYEDVLVVRVHDLVPEPVWRARYDRINDFEALLAGDGRTAIVKLFCTSRARSRPSGCRPGSTTRPSAGSSAAATSTSVRAGRLHGRLRGGDRAHVDPARAVVRRPRRPQVVPRLGGEPDRRRGARGDGPALPRAGRGPRRGAGHVRG